MNIASLIKKLITHIEDRNNQVVATCPTITSDPEERKRVHKYIAEVQFQIDDIVGKIRESTGLSMSDFSDEEIMVSCYLWASIWNRDSAINCCSRDFGDIVGRNRIGRLPELIERLLGKKSPILQYAELKWQGRYRGEGCYLFEIQKPAEFNALFLHGTSTNE